MYVKSTCFYRCSNHTNGWQVCIDTYLGWLGHSKALVLLVRCFRTSFSWDIIILYCQNACLHYTNCYCCSTKYPVVLWYSMFVWLWVNGRRYQHTCEPEMLRGVSTCDAGCGVMQDCCCHSSRQHHIHPPTNIHTSCYRIEIRFMLGKWR